MPNGNDKDKYVPFSQRTGLAPVPPQLKIGEVSKELRRLLDYYMTLEIRRHTGVGYGDTYWKGGWQRLAEDIHVLKFGQAISEFKRSPLAFNERMTARDREH